jgi:NAD(P)H-binding
MKFALVCLQAQDKMEWVIIRPGGLTNDPPTGKAFVTEEKGVCGAISREDVAPLIAKALFTSKLDGKVVSAVDAGRVTTDVSYEPIAL